MLHISVAEMFVNNLSAPHADMPVEVAAKPALFARLSKMIASVQGPPLVVPPLEVPIVRA